MATEQIHAPRLGDVGDACRSCGAALATDQRYCLNCGERRTGPRLEFGELFGPPPGATPPPAPPAAPAPRGSWWTPRNAALAAGGVLGVLLVGGLLGSALSDPEIQVAAPKPVVVAPAAAPAAAAAAAPAAATEFVSDWAGEDGWTIQLQTLPKDGTDPAAIAQAKTDATGKGAAEVGALDSDEYPSLDPSLYVIYSGVYTSKKDAQAALKDLEANFPDAKVVEVSTATDTADDAADDDAEAADTGGNGEKTASDSELKALENASGEEYVKESKKLKDTTQTEGAAPKPDDKAPGAGDEGEVLE